MLSTRSMTAVGIINTTVLTKSLDSQFLGIGMASAWLRWAGQPASSPLTQT